MPIQRRGNQFLEVIDEGGLRNLVRISAIQRVCDVDELGQETYLTIAGRVVLVRASLDEFSEILTMEPREGLRS